MEGDRAHWAGKVDSASIDRFQTNAHLSRI